MSIQVKTQLTYEDAADLDKEATRRGMSRYKLVQEYVRDGLNSQSTRGLPDAKKDQKPVEFDQGASPSSGNSFPLDASRPKPAIQPSGDAGAEASGGGASMAPTDGADTQTRVERLSEYLAHGKRVYSGERDGAGEQIEELRLLGGGGYRDIVKVVRRAGEAGGGY